MPGTYVEDIVKTMPSFAEFSERLAWLADRESATRDDVSDHCEGVAHFAALLATETGMSVEEIEAVRSAARWHDIGKLATPSEILRKPGRHNPDEAGIMRQHARDGLKLLGDDAPENWKDVALYHHERYDGHGYEGLKGEDIPFAARIVSIADVRDALVKERPYKKSMSEEKALFLMISDGEAPSVGRRAFDPYLLRVFVSMRLRDPALIVAPEARATLSAFAGSDPMSDIPFGREGNGGWVVKRSGYRIRYETADNGNVRMTDLRSPTGKVLDIRQYQRPGIRMAFD